jgi:RNA polymerase sigma-70 factor (ECF subfamily)
LSFPVDASSDSAHREFLRKQVSRYCPPWLRDRVDDIVQVAWLRLDEAGRKRERNRDPGPSLMSRVAYCATVDEIRRHRRRREVPVGEEHEMPAARQVDPARAAGAREIGRAIQGCLTGLLPGRRLAVALYLQGHTSPETGAILGWTLKRAENMIFRGLADLRRCLAGKGVTP